VLQRPHGTEISQQDSAIAGRYVRYVASWKLLNIIISVLNVIVPRVIGSNSRTIFVTRLQWHLYVSLLLFRCWKLTRWRHVCRKFWGFPNSVCIQELRALCVNFNGMSED
jgi:hypothetical protein